MIKKIGFDNKEDESFEGGSEGERIISDSDSLCI